MRLNATVGVLLAILLAACAPAQGQIQTQFGIKQLWQHPESDRVRVDSIPDPVRPGVPIDYVMLDGYRLILPLTGEIYVYPPGQPAPVKGYPGKDGGWPVQLVAYADKRLLFLAVSDGYLTPRKLKLVELNLVTNSCRQLAKARQIDSVRYSTDWLEVFYRRNGVPVIWRRPPQ